MSWCRALLVPLVLATAVTPAPAGLFSRKPKANPAERVPELLIQLKTSPDESVRSAAAEELRQYDPKAFPEIMTGLIDALGRDASPAVRSEAAASLGKLRPISQQAGYALEQAQANDGAMRVRLSARQSLWQYHLVGYRSGKPPENPANANKASATVSAPPGPSTPAAAMPRSPAPRGTPNYARETPEPPLAVPPSAGPASPPAVPVSRPKSLAPTQLVPVNPPKLQPAPSAPPAAKSAPAEAPPPPLKLTPETPKGDGPPLPPPG
jgi:hypothetical protein